jgi:nicotinamide-nucleotide amidase
MKAAILAIGTELTRGELTDTNGTWLSTELTGLGYDVREHAVVSDDGDEIVAAIDRLATRVELVIATGGLGPTTDDLTTAAASRALGVELVRDEESVERIRRRFAAFNREMSPSNLKQADFPVGARIVPNPDGTAPGFSIEHGKARFFFLPGVPSEMKAMFSTSIVPVVATAVERTTHQVHIRSFGLTESQVGEKLGGLERENPGVVLGYRASFPEIEVKVLARATDHESAFAIANRVAEEVRNRLGDAAYGDRNDSYPGAVGRALRERGLTVAVAESCTGGMVGSMLTSVPGSSEYLLLDAVTYSNASKTSLLGVSEDVLRGHGAVSAETASAMAEGALRISGADIAVSVTGIAGPGGGTEQKPIGTVWLALAQKDHRTNAKHFRLFGDRERIRTLSAYIALRLVLRAALGQPDEG